MICQNGKAPLQDFCGGAFQLLKNYIFLSRFYPFENIISPHANNKISQQQVKIKRASGLNWQN